VDSKTGSKSHPLLSPPPDGNPPLCWAARFTATTVRLVCCVTGTLSRLAKFAPRSATRFPEQAFAYCLRSQGISLPTSPLSGFYNSPLFLLTRLLETYMASSPGDFARSRLRTTLDRGGALYRSPPRDVLQYDRELLYGEHHQSHAESAFPLAIQRGGILDRGWVGGVGNRVFPGLDAGTISNFELLREIHWPDCLGLLYSAFTYLHPLLGELGGVQGWDSPLWRAQVWSI
jgi:predicted NodU family carbamoyl transferase